MTTTYTAWTKMWRLVGIYAARWYKETHGCVDCGITDPDLLTFDHVKDKAHNISDLLSGFSPKGRQYLWDELQKCVVRCHNCHMKITRLREREVYGTKQPPVLLPSHKRCGHRWGHCKYPKSPNIKVLYLLSQVKTS